MSLDRNNAVTNVSETNDLLMKSQSFCLCFPLIVCLFMLLHFLSFDPLANIPCDLLFEGNTAAIREWKNFSVALNDTQMYAEALTCNQFRRTRGYYGRGVNDAELSVPLAFSILVHRDLTHLELLLNAVWRPHNVYCIHVDRKSVGLEAKVRRLANCFDNVYVCEHSQIVYWGSFALLNATLNCLRLLLTVNANWKYFINLSAQDFPLKTNYEIVLQLQRLNNANMVEVLSDTNEKRIKFVYKTVKNKFGNPETNEKTTKLKEPPPDNMTIFKGNLAVALNRKFAQFIFSDRTIQKYLFWLQDTDVPDEHFFATIIGNAEKWANPAFLLNSPYYNVRHSVWRSSGNKCGGKFIRDVCVFGVEDLAFLNSEDYMFANKYYSQFQTATIYCLGKNIERKTQQHQT